MALIIPEAQTQASIAQQPRQNPNAPNGAEGIGAVGDIFVQLGARKVAAENDRTVRQARIATLQALDDARLKYETTGDLENLSANWQAEAKAITTKAAEAVPAHMRADFGVAMQEMVAPQTNAIKRREFALYQDRETAALNSDLRGYEKSAARAPTPEARDKIFSEMAADLGRAVTSGIVSAVNAEKMLADIPANTAEIEAITLMEEDPGAYRERADEFAAVLDPKKHAEFMIMDKRLVEAEGARKAREDELAASSLDKQLGMEADDAIKVIEGGLPLKGIVPLLTKLKGTSHYDRVAGALDAVGESGNFAMLPPSEQKKAIAELEATPTGNPADVGRINRLKDMAKATEEALAVDPLSYIREREINPVEPVNIGDKASVQARIALSEEAKRQYYPDMPGIKYFDQPEADRLGAILSGNDPDAALGVIANVMSTFGDRAPAALAQLGEKDPLGQLAGALVLETGETTAARMLMTGRKLKVEGNAAAVGVEVRRAVEAELAPLFPNTTDGKVRLKTLMDGMDMHYAASGIGIEDPKSDAAKSAYKASGYALMAEQTAGGATYGGVQKVNGVEAILPARMTARDVEMAVNYFPADAWKRASGGSVPRWGKNASSPELTTFSAEDRAKIAVLSLGGGLYTLTYGGRPLFDPAQRDGTFRFSMELLIKGGSGQ
jgi:hypothetical protein